MDDSNYVTIKNVSMQSVVDNGYGEHDADIVCDVTLELFDEVFADTPLGPDVRTGARLHEITDCVAYLIDHDGGVFQEIVDYEPDQKEEEELTNLAIEEL